MYLYIIYIYSIIMPGIMINKIVVMYAVSF